MKMKKIVAFLTAVIMVASLTACQTGKAPETDVLQEGETQNVSSEDSEDTTSKSSDKNLFGYEEPVTVKVGIANASDFTWYGGENLADNSWVDLYNENNIIPEVLYEVDASQGDTKLSTAIMSGNYPDVIKVTKAKISDFVNYANTGVLADITDVLEEYASDELKEYLYSDGGLAMQNVTIDGRVYGLPVLGSNFDSIPLMFIRQDWLDRLGLEMPTTMEELKAVAHAFTYDDPDGNGKDDTYGLALNGVDVLKSGVGDVNPVFNAYGAYPGNDGLAMIEGEDGKVTWGGTNVNGMKSGLTFLQELYADGSLIKDFITMDGNAVFEEAGSGRCGIWFGPMWGGMNPAQDLLATTPDVHITSSPIPSGLDQAVSQSLLTASVSSVYGMSSMCENPEVLIKLANLSVDKIVYPKDADEYNMYYGDYENYTGWKASLVHLEKPNKNYDIYLKLTEAMKTKDTSDLTIDQIPYYDMITAYLDAKEAGTIDAEDSNIRGGISRYTVFGDPQGSYAALHKMIENDDFVHSAYNAFPTESMTENAATLSKFTVEMIVKVITGDAVDNYDDFLESWYALGGDAAIAEAQEWADAN